MRQFHQNLGLRAPSQLTNTVRYFPIVFFQIFLTFTIVVFAFGPWDWPINNPLTLYAFLIAVQGMFLLGYLHAAKGREPAPFHVSIQPQNYVWLCAVVSLIEVGPVTYQQTGGDINFLRALLNPGDAYHVAHETVMSAGYNPWAYLWIMLSPLIWPLLPLTIFYWNRLSIGIKMLASIGVLAGAVSFWLIGTNKRLVDIMILTPWLMVLRSEAPARALNLKKISRFAMALGMAGMLFLPYFGLNIITRGSTGGIQSIAVAENQRVVPAVIELHGFEGRLADAYTSGATALASYVGQGYYGLSLSLQEPFVWCYGVGHSVFYSWVAGKVTGTDYKEILDRSYPRRIDRDFGWSADIKWASIYPYLASDVSFLGVPFVMYFFGRLLALTWIDSLGKNPFAVIVFSLTAITIFYASGNAQVFQDPDTVNVFYFYLVMWYLSNARYQPPVMIRRFAR